MNEFLYCVRVHKENLMWIYIVDEIPFYEKKTYIVGMVIGSLVFYERHISFSR